MADDEGSLITALNDGPARLEVIDISCPGKAGDDRCFVAPPLRTRHRQSADRPFTQAMAQSNSGVAARPSDLRGDSQQMADQRCFGWGGGPREHPAWAAGLSGIASWGRQTFGDLSTGAHARSDRPAMRTER